MWFLQHNRIFNFNVWVGRYHVLVAEIIIHPLLKEDDTFRYMHISSTLSFCEFKEHWESMKMLHVPVHHFGLTDEQVSLDGFCRRASFCLWFTDSKCRGRQVKSSWASREWRLYNNHHYHRPGTTLFCDCPYDNNKCPTLKCNEAMT